jgi:hypothetical protein
LANIIKEPPFAKKNAKGVEKIQIMSAKYLQTLVA